MAVTGPYDHSLGYIGLSTDTKPTENTPVGSKFLETDKRNNLTYTGSAWVETESEEE